MGGAGQVLWMFDLKGVLKIGDVSKVDQIMELSSEHGADDIDLLEDESPPLVVVSCDPAKIHKLRDEMEKKLGVSTLSCELLMVPKNEVSINEEEAESVLKLVDALEAHDDVQNVYHNAKFE